MYQPLCDSHGSALPGKTLAPAVVMRAIVSQLVRGAVLFSILALMIVTLVDPDAAPPMPIMNLDEEANKTATSRTSEAQQLAELIQNPTVMYLEYGIVPSPICFLSMKGIFNFAIQQILFLGMAIFGGWSALRAKYAETPRFSIFSRAFQVVGQSSIVGSYAKIIRTTQPWQGRVAMMTCTVLISQHSCSITGLTGLSNNLTLLALMDSRDEDSRVERIWAKYLAISGLILCLPMWLAMMVAFPFVLLPIILGFVVLLWLLGADLMSGIKTGMALVKLVVDIFTSFDSDSCYDILVIMAAGSTCGSIIATLVWLIMAINQTHAWLMLAAYVLELFLPVVLLFAPLVLLQLLQTATTLATAVATAVAPPTVSSTALARSRQRQPQQQQQLINHNGTPICFALSFMFSMNLAYMLSLGVPSAILAYMSDIGIMGAAPSAFWGKKVGIYATDTFTLPVFHAEHALDLWWSQVLSFFS